MTPKVSMLQEDTETVINYCQYHIGEWAELYTTDKTVMKRIEKFCEKHPDYGRLIKEDKYSMTFSMDPRCACVYPKAPRHVVLSDEQREILAKRFRKE